MRDCGLPKEVEDQCCLNRSGMCTLDTADYSDIDRATEMRGCGFIGVNDRYLLWKHGVTFKDFECRNCDYFSGGQSGHGDCTNPDVEPHPKGIVENGQKQYIDSKEYYSGAKACKKFVKNKEKPALYCSQDQGCICKKCLYHWSGRCPYGNCYDDLRAKINPYDKAHPGKPPRTSWSNWKEDQAYWCRGGTVYQVHECDNFVEYENSTVKECLEGLVQVYQDGCVQCSLVESVGCEECMRRFEGKQAKKEEEEVAKRTYWTKCGHEFEKNSTATVTGFEIPDSNERIISGICAACPFPVEVTEGWGENKKHVRWECRAGSQPPNHKTEWAGNLDDKNTIQINSLDYNLLEEIREYCEAHPDLGAGYNTDHLADCRRTLSVCCSPNKKGITAKHELIEKFFQDDRITQVRNLLSTLIGKEIRTHYNTGGIVTNVIGPHNAYGPGSWTINYTEDGKKRKNPCIINSIKVENGIITCDGKPLQIKEKRKCGNCNYGHWYSAENTYANVVSDDGTCTTKHPCEPNTHYCYQFTEGQKKIASDKEFNPDTCPDWCPLEEIESLQSCVSYQTNRDDYQANSKTCTGCSYWPVKGSTVCNHIGNDNEINESTPRCEHYRNPNEEKMEGCSVGENMKNVIKTQENVAKLNKNVTKGDEIVTFDYTSVDGKTADFLQDKAEKIAAIRMRSVMAIGKELSETFEKFSKLPYGNKTEMFDQWCESIGITSRTARNYINGYEYILKNFQHIEDANSIQPSLLFAVSKPSARPELQEAVLTGDIKTHKEYKELEQKLKDAEFHYDRIKGSYERLEKVNSEHYRMRTRAEEAERKLQAKLDQAMRNSDPEKVKELDQSIREKQQEIEELRQQLRDKPIEVEAVRVVEKLPENIEITQYHLKNYAKVNTVLEMVESLTTEEMQSWAKMMNDRQAVNDADESCWLEVLTTIIEKLQDMEEDYRQGGEKW